MTSTMVRTFAVAALSAGAMVFGSAVEAAPNSASQFAGRYTGPVPGLGGGDWGSVTVSSGGGIAFSQPPAGVAGWKVSGAVTGDGTFTITGKYHVPGNGGFFKNDLPAPVQTSNPVDGSRADAAEKRSIALTWYFQSSGTVARGGDGNLSGITTGGDPFVWLRK